MSADGEDDYEHWPSAAAHNTESVAAAPGYDNRNGLHFHTYTAAKNDCAPPAAAIQDPTLQSHVINYPQPVFYAHPPNVMAHPQSQYYSQPVYNVPPGYYQPYPNPNPAAPAAAPPAAAAQPAMPSQSGSRHVYIPTYDAPKAVEASSNAPQANVYLGRTTAQVEEDNMKIAAREGAYGKRKVAPVDVKDDQMCWVVEIDGSHSLRYVVLTSPHCDLSVVLTTRLACFATFRT